ncbi:MAG: hypothetical protein ABSG37_06755 [Candidatus Limnocylindrales bacterium]|jgi:hypothetical protein
MAELVAALAFVALAVVAFVVSVRVGMLVGRRLDRALEARASAAEDAGRGASIYGAAPLPANAPENPISIHVDGLEEDRGE